MLIRADARSLPLRDGCVDCVVTSPPYWGLRDYGSAGQIGLERTPDAYVRDLVAVFAEVRRVLKPEGTVWCNLGDSYGSPCGGGYGPASTLAGFTNPNTKGRQMYAPNRVRVQTDVKAKDLVGIPWRVAFALQADGWYLRSDIIWSKPNPMPESVTDRPTKAHEYLFLLTKSERYFYDASAIAEPVSAAMLMEMEQGYDGLGLKDYEAAGVQNPSTVKARIIANARRKADASNNGRSQQATNPESERRDEIGTFNNNPRLRPNLTRNRRSVWTVNTMPYAGAHFATMPEKLVEPCILAGCPLGGLVLDPFVGSGTVVAVAQRLGRRGVGVDLSYQQLAKERTAQRGLIYGEETA
jgi:DNA modification methylase